MYGYPEDPMQKGHWIIDPETAPVVKRIFDLALAGNGPKRIANQVEDMYIMEDTQETIVLKEQ